jgi:hypothetical protein
MSHKKCLHAAAVVGAAVLSSMASAHADTLYSQNVMVTSTSAPNVQSLGTVSSGTVTMSVSDLMWPQALQSLSFSITNNQGVLKSLTGPGSLSYLVTGPMTLFADVYAQPNAADGAGLYHINVSFIAATPAVPLPAAGWLLLSGMVGLATFKKKMTKSAFAHATVTNPVVQ